MGKAGTNSKLAGISARTLSLITFFVSIPLLLAITSIPGIGSFALVIYGLLIAAACFYICMLHPKSFWYTLLICNAQGILSIVQMTRMVLSTPDTTIPKGPWIFWGICFALSIIGAIIGTKIGRR